MDLALAGTADPASGPLDEGKRIDGGSDHVEAVVDQANLEKRE